ncbi:MAG: Eco29kI family restriction endonuclease [Bdellovibrionales bacterium]|nr:Eco29kI family restriction endonuclease [Bdellovibrionales bacterium]
MTNIHGKDDEVFNPFSQDIVDLLVKAFESCSLEQLPPEKVGKGPGVYGLFYRGEFNAYKRLAKQFRDVPIYVGKAVVPGGRKGSGTKSLNNQNYVIRRLMEHGRTISQTKRSILKISDAGGSLLRPNS